MFQKQRIRSSVKWKHSWVENQSKIAHQETQSRKLELKQNTKIPKEREGFLVVSRTIQWRATRTKLFSTKNGSNKQWKMFQLTKKVMKN